MKFVLMVLCCVWLVGCNDPNFYYGLAAGFGGAQYTPQYTAPAHQQTCRTMTMGNYAYQTCY